MFSVNGIYLVSGNLLHGGDDIAGAETLGVDLLVQTTAALLDGTDGLELGGELALEEVCTEAGAETGLLGDRLNDEDEW